ncbi:glucan biosynthesis protein [Stigmatella hybrida]|uniref:glucan biosynthesis protein n=1 Tax=Stigmatella hybrida TaxID=394097 RepID=UPI001CDA9B5E|nr:glucan biosynthesis protein [Stigmatella hybrida]
MVRSRKRSRWGVRTACVLGVLVAGAAGAQVKLSSKGASAKASAQASKTAFSPELVREKARALAGQGYKVPTSNLSASYEQLSYDEYRDIRFRPDQSLWRKEGLPFQAQFFHPGFYYKEPVAVHVVRGKQVEDVPFSPELFSYGPLVKAGPLAKADGFAGLRLNHPINRPEHFDEVAVFLGASYFRSLGRGNVYGLSARGLAIDTALPSGEEFPAFREFWLEKPEAKSDRVVVHALLDSPSVTGAYRFVIIPGKSTVMEVEATLFARKPVKQLGIAPLTSMYLFGENNRGTYDDFRPEVHDSDGLFISMKNGEQLWRPLQNPARLNVASFQAESPRAFGLLQRDQSFANYEDLEARYELRPSVWVEPVGDWGKGAVQLVEIPTREEIHDNIVAAWVPEQPLTPGTERRFAYRLYWGFEPPRAPPGATVLSTRIAAGSTPKARRFVIDFSGGGAAGDAPAEAVITASRGQVLHPIAQRNTVTGGWRATFELLPDDSSAPIELRGFLKTGSETLTETWSYLWTP